MEEFSYLFKSKNQNYVLYDNTLANQIIACFFKSPDFTNDEKSKEMLIDTIKTLEELYPKLIKTA